MSYFSGSELFSRNSLRVLILERNQERIAEEIQRLDKNIILYKNIDEILDSFKSRYILDQIVMHKDLIHLLDPSEISVSCRNPIIGNTYEEKTGKYTIVIPFEGDGNLLYHRPSLHIFTRINGVVFDNEIHLYFIDTERGNLQREIDQTIKYVDDYIDSINSNINEYNTSLDRHIKYYVSNRKKTLQTMESKANALIFPIKRRDKPPPTFQVPIKRKQVKLVPPSKEEISAKKIAPSIAPEIYEAILEICNSMSLVMERNPGTFREFDEESIRDVFLLVLNAFFEGEATGETFNKKGKTDILIRHENSNLFIAECKFWAGAKVLNDTIDQLLGYTTWRDSKTAIFIFNKTVQISTILNKLDSLVKENKNYKRNYNLKSEKLTNEGIYSYVFSLPEDNEIEIFLTILIFDIPEPI